MIIGQQICIPLEIQHYPSCPTTNYYVVRKNDSIDNIASYFNVTPIQLLYSNYGIDPNDLYQNQILCIPVAPSPVEIRINLNDSDAFLSIIQNGTLLKNYQIMKIAPLQKGVYTILNKQVSPSFRFGTRYLGLSKAGLGIHGGTLEQYDHTINNDKNIILSNKDINELFNLVPVGTTVTI